MYGVWLLRCTTPDLGGGGEEGERRLTDSLPSNPPTHAIHVSMQIQSLRASLAAAAASSSDQLFQLRASLLEAEAEAAAETTHRRELAEEVDLRKATISQ